MAKTITVRGFTLVELIMALAIMAILAVYVLPRFFSVGVYQERGFADQVQAVLRYAQKAAIAQHRAVCAAYTASPERLSLSITVTTSCDTALSVPASSVNYIEAPSGIAFSMTPASISFDALGRPSASAVATVGTATITVEAETGYVHQ
ncbi:MAG TPA: prepilin-type N-terminal cleavage/methylation domain-containing protein [Gallionella sp.]|nr:prepilin-type N-terminal cleavage/methylation domain-containing protein [Gallionella sp.]